MLSDTLQAGALATRLISQEFEVGMLTSLIEKQAPDSPEVAKLKPRIYINHYHRPTTTPKKPQQLKTQYSDLNTTFD